jgi:hypothetical protein
VSLPEHITIWVCKDCGNYYASSSAGDLRTEFNKDMKGQPTFARARCPTLVCATNGTLRIPYVLPLLERIQRPNPERRIRRGEPVMSGISDAPLPNWSGELCPTCASEMVRTGNCLTCPQCGDNTGCS